MKIYYKLFNIKMRLYYLIALFIIANFTSFAQNKSVVVHFDFNKSDLTIQATSLLDNFIAINKTDNNFFALCGHTDSKGSYAYNFALSQRRVIAVKEYLIKNGFPKNFIQKENALGKTKLLLIDDADENKGEINRRVEILFTSNLTSPEKKEIITEPKSERTIKEIIEDTATKKGSVIIFKNMQFVGGRHKILENSLPQLTELLSALKANTKLKIAIEGHICCLPGNTDGLDFDTNTQDLSVRRAKAIYEYLVYAGIDEERLQFKGLGHSFPIYPYPEKDENEKTMNRRVEIKIIDK
jgi:outer membrane protein OmpA-like peptidoglycan-associated protein